MVALEVVEYLLEQGADRDQQDIDGHTPLHVAAQFCHLEVAKALIKYGVNLDAKNERGSLPIDMTGPKIKQAILDVQRRRNDHTYKRIREEDLQPAQKQEVEEEEGAAVEAEDKDESDDDGDCDDDDDEED